MAPASWLLFLGLEAWACSLQFRIWSEEVPVLFFGGGYWGDLNSGFHTCKTGAVWIMPHLQPTLLCYDYFGDGGRALKLFAQAGL
jgi:hypothetical protein